MGIRKFHKGNDLNTRMVTQGIVNTGEKGYSLGRKRWLHKGELFKLGLKSE
jgi:hypothetical protein